MRNTQANHSFAIVGASHASCTACRLCSYFVSTEFTAGATRSKAHATSEGSKLMLDWCLPSIRIRVGGSLCFKCCDNCLYITRVHAHGSPTTPQRQNPNKSETRCNVHTPNSASINVCWFMINAYVYELCRHAEARLQAHMHPHMCVIITQTSQAVGVTLSAFTLSKQRGRACCNMRVLQHRHHMSHEGPIEQKHAQVPDAHLPRGIQLDNRRRSAK